MTQPALAEKVDADTHTVQSWESGRRSLAATSVRDFVRLRLQLLNSGADSRIVDAMDAAVSADYILSEILDAVEPAEPDTHPLANWLIPADVSGMLGWPLTGSPPPALRHVVRRSRRGPVPSGPELTMNERRRFFLALRSTADRLRRSHLTLQGRDGLFVHQAYFRIGWDPQPESQEWLTAVHRQLVGRSGSLSEFGPGWLAVRAIVIALAGHGDPEPLRHFIRLGHGVDSQETANLNYWAYWVGEIRKRQNSETFMPDPRILQSWPGDMLLRELVHGITAKRGYSELHLHTIRRLLERPAPRELVKHDRRLWLDVVTALERLYTTTSDEMPGETRRDVESIYRTVQGR